MRKHRPSPCDPWRLRQAAEIRLELGYAPAARGWPIGWRALRLLHDFACDPKYAPDAIKLLQELQIQQVELDLQREHIESMQSECAIALANLRDLIDFVPIALLRLDLSGTVLEANAACTTILGVAPGEFRGRCFDDSLATASRKAWVALRMQLVPGDARVTGCIQLDVAGSSRAMSFVAAIGADAASILLAIRDA